MRRRLIRGAALTAIALAAPVALLAQTAAPAPAAMPAVGDSAPDFVLPGATAAGSAGPAPAE